MSYAKLLALIAKMTGLKRKRRFDVGKAADDYASISPVAASILTPEAPCFQRDDAFEQRICNIVNRVMDEESAHDMAWSDDGKFDQRMYDRSLRRAAEGRASRSEILSAQQGQSDA